jgi:hypothetical protein
LLCQSAEHRKLVAGEVVHDLVRVTDVALLVVVALNEALHIRLPPGILGCSDSAKYLQVDGGKVMVGVRIQLALELSIRRDFDRFARRVEVELGAREAVDGRVIAVKSPEHMVEGAILHHEDHDVFQILDSRKRSVQHG